MATRREYEHAAHTEFNQLHLAWFEMFVNIPDAEGQANEDMYHTPPALRYLVQKILDEGAEAINERMAELNADGSLEPGGPSYDYAFQAFGQYSLMLAVRMYRLGQHMVTKLPYANIQPCPCSVMTDDDFAEVENFLRDSREVITQLAQPEDGDIVFGDGWVITSFGSTKE